MPHECDCGSPTMARAAACVSCGVHAVMTILVIHTATKMSRLESELERCRASMLDSSSMHVSWSYTVHVSTVEHLCAMCRHVYKYVHNPVY